MDYDKVYDAPDADDVVVIRMTKRQWWHLDDWRGEYPEQYPKRAAVRAAAWDVIHAAGTQPPGLVPKWEAL